MQVTRRRRSARGSNPRHLVALIATASCLLVATGGGIAYARTDPFGTEQVGQTTDQGLVVSAGQHVKSIGARLVLNTGKIMSAVVSPDGTHLAAAVTDDTEALTIVDLRRWRVQQVIGNNPAADLRIGGNDVGQEGPTYSPDGKQLLLGQTNGYRKFTVRPDGTLADPTVIAIAADGPRHALVAAAVFSPDGATVYSAVNGQNRVVALDSTTGVIQRSWAVGIAPRDLVRVGTKLYVSNEGGRLAKPGDPTLNSYHTAVPVDPITAATTTGTVSVIDLAHPRTAVASIGVGLHPTTLYAPAAGSQRGTVFVTNTASNDVSVIDTNRDAVVQTIATQPWPEASVGYEPDAVTLTADGHLLVTLGRANAVAVYRFSSPQEPASYLGLLPTDYFPAEITTVGNDVLVANTRGIDARRPITAAGHSTHDTTSSLQRFRLPSDRDIRSMTAEVFRQNGWTHDAVTYSHSTGGGLTTQPVPVPVRLGDPSTIKHVFLIVKENRTYDQLFGDVSRGNGDPALAEFGAKVTPNQRSLAEQFGLYDNTYDIGTNSAEGHNWLMQADNPEYSESSAGEYARSYDTEDDALGHQRTGFLWTGAQAAGHSVRDYGEFHQFLTKPPAATWQNLYCDSLRMSTGRDTAYPMVSSSPIPSLNSVSVPGFPKFDTSVPDVYRYQIFKRDFDRNGPANLNLLWFSSDHTGGPPTAAAQVADNDLAVGKTVDTIAHSKYWKDSAIFVVEDDSQAGLDHIDGHRAPIQIISPYARRRIVDHHYYSQLTIIRTIEQILGIHPMNQKDSAASPMNRVFTNRPDFTTFTAVRNRTSLTLGLSKAPPCGADIRPDTAAPPEQLPVGELAIAAQWKVWATQQQFTGPEAKPDVANPAQMNHFTWYQAHSWTKPYPGEQHIVGPAQVPGAYLPPPDSD